MPYILSSILHTANVQIRESRPVVAYKSLKTMENHYCQAQKVVSSLTGGGRLLEVLTVML